MSYRASIIPNEVVPFHRWTNLWSKATALLNLDQSICRNFYSGGTTFTCHAIRISLFKNSVYNSTHHFAVHVNKIENSIRPNVVVPFHRWNYLWSKASHAHKICDQIFYNFYSVRRTTFIHVLSVSLFKTPSSSSDSLIRI